MTSCSVTTSFTATSSPCLCRKILDKTQLIWIDVRSPSTSDCGWCFNFDSENFVQTRWTQYLVSRISREIIDKKLRLGIIIVDLSLTDFFSIFRRFLIISAPRLEIVVYPAYLALAIESTDVTSIYTAEARNGFGERERWGKNPSARLSEVRKYLRHCDEEKIFERMCAKIATTKYGNKTNKQTAVVSEAKKISLSRIFCADNENDFSISGFAPHTQRRAL